MKPDVIINWCIILFGTLTWDDLQKYLSKFTIHWIFVQLGNSFTKPSNAILLSSSFEGRNLPVTTHEM